MKKEDLYKAKELVRKMDNLEKGMISCRWMTNKSIAPRECHLSVNGIEGGLNVPDSLFRKIGEMLLEEYNNQYELLKKELDKI